MVELETAYGDRVWVNPGLVARIHSFDGITVVTCADGTPFHVKGTVAAILDRLQACGRGAPGQLWPLPDGEAASTSRTMSDRLRT